MEKLFGYFYKNRLVRSSKKDGYIDLSESIVQLTTFANLVSFSETPVEVGLSLWACGFVDNELLLPLQLRWTEDKELNFDLLKLLILKSTAIKELDIAFSFKDKSRNFPRVQMLAYMPIINTWLDTHFSNYSSLENDTFKKYFSEIKKKHLKTNKILDYWKNQITCRSSDQLMPLMQDKTNDEALDYLLATVPLPLRFTKLNRSGETEQTSSSSSSSKSKTRNRKEYVLNSDEEKKSEVNPVTHSFEKMETLDDYSGGRRMTSGDDDLDDHSNALDEVEMNQFTNQGKASSVFRQDMQLAKNTEADISSAVLDTQAKYYAEWNYRNNSYTKDHCQVFEVAITPQDNSLLRNEIITQYAKEISYFKNYYSAMWNKPLWQSRKVEGPELDLDSLIRLAPEFRTVSGSPRIYQRKINQDFEMHISIVVDISYSTDTWINGQKIIHIIRNSLVVFGEAIHALAPQLSLNLSFSQTRKNISYLPLLDFATSWQLIYPKLHEFSPRQYTRLGPSIRHATQKLHRQQSKNPLLIVVTDGKPTDLDPYEGKYGQEDVKKSIDEAIALGLSPLVVGITDLAPDILAKITQNCVNVQQPYDFCLEVGKFIHKSTLK